MNEKTLKLLTKCAALSFVLGLMTMELRAQTAAEEDTFAKQQAELFSKNPAGLDFTLKLRDNKTQFHIGEKIRLELSFASSAPDKFVLDNAGYDRSGRLMIDTFVLDLPDAASDPLYDYYHKSIGPFMGGGLRGNPALGPKPEKINYDLNEWLRFEKPGKYRLYVVSHRVSIGKPFHGGSKPVEPASNIIEFEVIPAERDWEQATLSLARKVLDTPPNAGYSIGQSERQSACRTLRFLGTDAAVNEIVERFRGQDRECDFEYYMGMIGAPNPTFTIEQMETALGAPTHPISNNFLSALVFLSYIRQHPEPWPQFATDDAGQKAARAQWDTRMANYRLISNAYVSRLASAIAQKQGAAAAISIQTLLSYQQNDQAKDIASNRHELAASLAKVFLDLPSESQRNLLEYNWEQIADQAMLPSLRQLYAHPPDLHEIPAPFPGVALQRIYELSPVKGRQLILDEIKRPVPRVNIHVLGSLPDKELPDLEDAIVQHLIDFTGEYRSQETAAALIARYVSPASLPRVRAAFEDKIGTFGCIVQSSLIEYFLRSNQEVGLLMLRKELATRKGTRCYATALANAAAPDRQLTPPAESLALEYLNDSDPDVVLSAVGVLSAHGSSDNQAKIKAAIKQLLDRFRAEKRDPESNISSEDPVQVGYFVESLLRSYARAVSWMVDDEEIAELASLCPNEQCRRETKSWSPKNRTEITIYRSPGFNQEPKFSVGFFELLSWKDLKRKLIQFPRGTKFTWQLHNRENETDRKLFDELQSYLKEHEMEITRPPKG